MPRVARTSSTDDATAMIDMVPVPADEDDFQTHCDPMHADDAATAVAAAVAPTTATHRLLYVTYFLAAWGDRMWEFAGVIFLLDLFPDNLLPASLFGVIGSISGILTGPSIGRYIDGNNRLKVIRTSVIGQNISVGLAGLVYFLVLDPFKTSSQGGNIGAFCFFTLMEVTSKFFSSMNKISLHKDWIVVIGGGEATRQAEFNAAMRRVDLTCAILAPMAVGLGSLLIGDAYTCICIASWSSISLFVEFLLNQQVYNTYPALQRKTPKVAETLTVAQIFAREVANQKAFYKHRAFRVSLPYCLLYCSILSFAGILASYLKTRGVDAIWLAAGRGIAALVAIGATIAVPKMVPKLGLWTSGRITLWAQLMCLTPLPILFVAFPSYGDQSSTWFIVLVFVSICASRFGLWGFDLCETQLMQELIEKDQTGVINGGQETLTNVCYVLSYLFTMIASNPDHFVWPVCLSYACVLAAAIIFTLCGQSPPVDAEAEVSYSRAPRDAPDTM